MIKTAEEILFSFGDRQTQWDGTAYYSKASVLRAMEAYAEQFKPKWISITEMLPEKGDDYNIVIDLQDGMGGPVSGSGEFDGIRKVFCYQGTDIIIDNVTHWQPIQDPPETVK